MEPKGELTIASVKALEKEQAPPDAYGALVEALVRSTAAGPLGEMMRVWDAQIAEAISGWSTKWSTAARPGDTVSAHSRQRFGYLVGVWRHETAFYASVKDRVIHWSYQQIIGMGPTALPLILEELRSEEDDWFWALTAIVGDDVGRGAETMADATTRWLQWAEQHDVHRGVLT